MYYCLYGTPLQSHLLLGMPVVSLLPRLMPMQLLHGLLFVSLYACVVDHAAFGLGALGAPPCCNTTFLC